MSNSCGSVVKIDQEGLVSGTQNAGKWAGDSIMDTLTWTSTIPASLAPGNYLIRHELIAVHQANNPQCTLPRLILKTIANERQSTQNAPSGP
jgi:hypothetical protein